jgi:acyl transferase domain-containing protein
VGSVKPNVGHTESCSGITGIIKTVLALNHEIIPPHIGCTNLNPRINLKVIPAQIPFECVPWKRNGTKPRKAGVSSFGITGTDAHVILEEAPVLSIITKLAPLPTLPIQVLSLSAKSEEALDAMLMSYKKFLRQYPGPLSNVTFTANTGRAALSPFRAAVVGTDAIDIATKLENGSLFKRGQVLSAGQEPPKLIMVFSGNNNYYHGMGQTLYKTFPVFQHWMDTAFKLIFSETGLDFKKLMWEDDPDDIMKNLNSIGSLSIQYAIFKLWESLGVKPDIVLGHSLGEYMASLVAGFIDLKDAVKVSRFYCLYAIYMLKYNHSMYFRF